jgi:quinol monooxygenase YgiN
LSENQNDLHNSDLIQPIMNRFKAALGEAEKPCGIVARFKVNKDKLSEMREAIEKSVPPTQQEAGCLHYEYSQDIDDETVFVLVEQWRDLQKLAMHFKTSHFQEVAQTLDAILAEEPVITLTSPVKEERI